ncbi:MAG: succinate dehydrogenase, cytochrome b556 subunit, partial [Pseudomonadota bacterium]|nr:succinate dehydrogenase, cytochrome b556 subunit [Pseudomonadota bacterium]
MSTQRPLSPHLTIYRPLIGAFTSILHRAMNAALFAGCGVFAIWLFAAARGGAFFTWYNGLLHSLIGRALLVALTFAACYSAAQWIRHL